MDQSLTAAKLKMCRLQMICFLIMDPESSITNVLRTAIDVAAMDHKVRIPACIATSRWEKLVLIRTVGFLSEKPFITCNRCFLKKAFKAYLSHRRSPALPSRGWGSVGKHGYLNGDCAFKKPSG